MNDGSAAVPCTLSQRVLVFLSKACHAALPPLTVDATMFVLPLVAVAVSEAEAQPAPLQWQSAGQLVHVSPVSQTPFPQAGGHAPQSVAQLLQVSPVSQTWLPQTGAHAEQSAGQVLHVSPLLHTPSPQLAVLAAALRKN